MPKKLTDRENNDLINRRDDARKKSEYYANDAQHNSFLEKNRSRSPFVLTEPDFKSKADASNALANMYEQEAENLNIRRQPNSIQQYRHEKEAGDPSALRLSFEEWKKL